MYLFRLLFSLAMFLQFPKNIFRKAEALEIILCLLYSHLYVQQPATHGDTLCHLSSKAHNNTMSTFTFVKGDPTGY